MCHRSIDYVADMIEEKYGIPWVKVNFIGANATVKSLRKIAQYFEDDALTKRVEKAIAEEMKAVEEAQRDIRSRCEGKLAMLFVGGSRAHHYQELFSEIGMKTIAAGYEFAHLHGKIPSYGRVPSIKGPLHRCPAGDRSDWTYRTDSERPGRSARDGHCFSAQS
ncbi:MAG: hypothetical protein JSW27_12275 [Phycisphaerales bacterium]|nr:MAG: hypothetical protein JSW27_12275 [Phycisphaerales bacterium]